jgi:hypothetical protein
VAAEEDRRAGPLALKEYMIPRFGRRKLADFTRGDVRRFHDKLEERPRAHANRCAALLSVMFRRPSEWGHLPEVHPDRARSSTSPAASATSGAKEMPRLVESIRADESPHVQAAIWL